MPQWKLDHFPDPLDLAVESPNVLVGDNRYTLLLRGRLAHHLNHSRLRDLYRTMRPRSSRDQRDSAAEDAEESHVTLDKGHVHEPSLHKPNKLLINAQSNISRRKDNCL